MNKKLKIEGVYSALMTPYDENGKINFDALEQMIHFLIEKGVGGVFPASNVGEFLLLSLEEKKQLVKAVIEMSKGKLQIFPGISSLSVDESIEMASLWKEYGADALVLNAPYYYPYSQEYCIKFIEAVVDKCELPVIFYNSPKFVTPLTNESLTKILKNKKIVAVKDSSNNMSNLTTYMNTIEKIRDDFTFMIGFEELFLSALSVGVKACMVSSATIIPEILLKIYKDYNNGDIKSAAKAQKSLCYLTSVYSKIGFPEGYKLGVMARGIDFNLYRSPTFESLNKEQKEKIPMLKEIIEKEIDLLNII